MPFVSKENQAHMLDAYRNKRHNLVTGRLMHHLKEVEGMSLRTVDFCVFDEADRLFEMGFAAQLREILSKMNEARQVRLFHDVVKTYVVMIRTT